MNLFATLEAYYSLLAWYFLKYRGRDVMVKGLETLDMPRREHLHNRVRRSYNDYNLIFSHPKFLPYLYGFFRSSNRCVLH